MENKPSKKPYGKWIGLVNIPIQMGVIIYAFYYIGFLIDEKHPDNNGLYVKILTMVGVFIALYNVIRQVKQLNDSNDK